ncbi:hypothetical protein FKM82_018356 [Ascaphus truei]
MCDSFVHSFSAETSQDTINNSVLPINDQMATEKEATYASVNEMKNSNVSNVEYWLRKKYSFHSTTFP